MSAFLQLLVDTPMEKLSLRKLAARVGVAPTAAYNHFANKDELLVAVKEQCLQHFTAYLHGVDALDSAPAKRIRNLGRGYFQYSVEHSHYFNMIFGVEVQADYITESLIEKSMQAEAVLRRAVVDLLAENHLPTSQYNEGLGAFACWSVAHGVTTLAAKHVNAAACMEGRWPPEFMLHNPDSIKKSFDAMTDVLVAGILAAARTDEPG